MMHQANIADIVELAIQLRMDPSSLFDVPRFCSPRRCFDVSGTASRVGHEHTRTMKVDLPHLHGKRKYVYTSHESGALWKKGKESITPNLSGKPYV